MKRPPPADVEVPLAEFEALAVDPASWPPEGPPEIAFAGRSNVGKSSLINALCQRKALARTSTTPGRTRGLVFFRARPRGEALVRLVDLPGYGYARASKQEREAWRPMVESYVEKRHALRVVVVLVDARRGAEAEEVELCEWLRTVGKPCTVVLTKADQLPATRRGEAARKLARELGLAHPALLFSTLERLGQPELWHVLLRQVASETGHD
jgi:GTP-binding protein